MDDGDLAELRALRARAYGPDADIAADPVAVARLRELEAPSPIAVPASGAVVSSPSAIATVDPEPDDGSPGETGASAPDRLPGDASSTTRRRRMTALWAASVVIAAVVGGGVVATATGPTPSSVAGAHYYATLHQDDDFEPPWWLVGDRVDDVHGFRDYHGLTLVASTADWGGGRSDLCLNAYATADLAKDAIGAELVAPSCVADPFAAAISLTVDIGDPDSLRRTFGDGTALQFVLVGDEVEVLRADADPSHYAGTAFDVECATCHGSGG